MAEILLIFGLILLNGVFSMAEIALVSARKARLEAQAAKGDKKAQAALKLSIQPDTFLSTVQIGITLIGILNGIFSGDHIRQNLQDWLNRFEVIRPYSEGAATTIVVIVLTYFTLVFGELLPKRIGLNSPESIAKLLAGPMRMVSVITYPFIWLLSKSTGLLVRLIGLKGNDTQVTEEEIKAIISEGTEHGAIEEAEQEIIERVFHLGDRNITSLMTHRSDIVWLDEKSSVHEVKEQTRDAAYSLYPVCDNSIDNIKGVVFLKDLFTADTNAKIHELCSAALYVPENISAYQLLERFKESKQHYSFIVDEYGTLQGLITLNDVLEAIVGEWNAPDEDDYEVVEREDGTFLVDAQLPFYDFLSRFERTEFMNEGEQEFDTLAGFILHTVERIPATGDKFEWKGFCFEIIDMDGHRIDKVLVTISEAIRQDLETEGD